MADDRIVLQADIGDSAQALQSLGIRLHDVEIAAAGVGQTTQPSGQFGRGMVNASYAVQDFTSQLGTRGLAGALGAIQNNIPQLLSSLGAGAGLAGVLSLASLGVGLLYENWDKIATLWGKGQTEEEAKRMKELAKATEDAEKAAEALLKTLPPELRGGPEGMKRAAEAFGGPAVLEELRQEILQTGAWGDAAKEMARVLAANLNRGQPAALRFLQEQRPMGPVGVVLRGGQTPEEERQAQLKRGAEGLRQADRVAEERKRERDKAVAEERKEADAAADRAKQRQEKMDQERARKLQQDVQLGRRVGRAAADQAGPQVPRMGHIPLIDEGTTAMDMQTNMIRSQEQQAENQRALAEANRDLQRVMRRNRENADFIRAPDRNGGHP
jgi:hypothetical protein